MKCWMWGDGKLGKFSLKDPRVQKEFPGRGRHSGSKFITLGGDKG
jgi:hypothetical protein